MTTRPFRTNSRGARIPPLAATLAVLGIAAPVHGATGVIDDFAGGICGNRTVDLLPPPFASTPQQGTFGEGELCERAGGRRSR